MPLTNSGVSEGGVPLGKHMPGDFRSVVRNEAALRHPPPPGGAARGDGPRRLVSVQVSRGRQVLLAPVQARRGKGGLGRVSWAAPKRSRQSRVCGPVSASRPEAPGVPGQGTLTRDRAAGRLAGVPPQAGPAGGSRGRGCRARGWRSRGRRRSVSCAVSPSRSGPPQCRHPSRLSRRLSLAADGGVLSRGLGVGRALGPQPGFSRVHPVPHRQPPAPGPLVAPNRQP